jgi:thiosulfate dehydrogenase [quinone] large subunit
MKTQKIVFLLLRLSMGFIFLWAFLDKTFGLGFATKAAGAWIRGGSPTSGFLGNAVKGPFVDIFHSLSGLAEVPALFPN